MTDLSLQELVRPQVMGVLNVTPDSFSDGGQFTSAQEAIEAGLRMVAEGADWIDVGGQSSRPGSQPVTTEEEISRTQRVIEGLVAAGATVSIDTHNPEVAVVALASGAKMVNDISGLRSPQMRRVCSIAGCRVTIMHMQGDPSTMQTAPHYGDVVGEVRDYLTGQALLAESEGISRENIWIDPGIGFGKTLDHNVALISGLSALIATNYPVLIGVSRKSFLGRLTCETNPRERLAGAIAVQTICQVLGVHAIRTHDVKETVGAITVLNALKPRF